MEKYGVEYQTPHETPVRANFGGLWRQQIRGFNPCNCEGISVRFTLHGSGVPKGDHGQELRANACYVITYHTHLDTSRNVEMIWWIDPCTDHIDQCTDHIDQWTEYLCTEFPWTEYLCTDRNWSVYGRYPGGSGVLSLCISHPNIFSQKFWKVHPTGLTLPSKYVIIFL